MIRSTTSRYNCRGQLSAELRDMKSSKQGGRLTDKRDDDHENPAEFDCTADNLDFAKDGDSTNVHEYKDHPPDCDPGCNRN